MFRTPVVAQCRGKRRQLVVWGRWRDVGGAVAQVQREVGGAWVDAGRALAASAPSAAIQQVVAWQGGAPARLHWTAPGGQVADSPAVAPLCSHPQKSVRSHGKVRRAKRGRMPMMHL